MKLATWNLERAKNCAALRQCTDEQNADVWVLTETHDVFSTGQAHSSSASARRDGTKLDGTGDRWVTITSKHPIQPLATTDGVRTHAARVSPKEIAPFVVFGTVLPWRGDKWRGFSSAGGVAFAEALKVQLADWRKLRAEFPEDEFFVLGDFNQDLAAEHYYGSKVSRAALTDALDAIGCTALTGGEGDPIVRDSAPFACIDHICARRDSCWTARAAQRWPDSPQPVRALSDHFGVSIEFSLS